jgi:uncharacterized protein YbaA (DUF1428 family)
MKNEFTLEDVVSDRICDPKDGWRDRKPEEAIVLSEAQKTAFYNIIGYRRRSYTKIAIERYISDPRFHKIVNQELGDMKRRIVFKGDLVQVYARQDYTYDLSFIARTIAQFS